MQRSSWLRLLILPSLAVGLTVLWMFVPVVALASDFQAWIDSHDRYLGLLLLALAYTPACLTFFPALVLTMAAGALYGGSARGVVEATLFISLGALLAATVAFSLGRTLLRGWIEQKVANSARFQALDRAVGEQGFRIVLLNRLSPAFPFTLSSYIFGLTRVSWRDYLVASWIGMLPGTVMYISLGSAAKGLVVLIRELSEGRVTDNLNQAVVAFIGLAATVGIVVVVTRIARKALRQAMEETKAPEA
jgi:uncharacterized membrane protein YdjX (TVP38/TMEM64 family)